MLAVLVRAHEELADCLSQVTEGLVCLARFLVAWREQRGDSVGEGGREGLVLLGDVGCGLGVWVGAWELVEDSA